MGARVIGYYSAIGEVSLPCLAGGIRPMNCGVRDNKMSGTALSNPRSSQQSYPVKPLLEFLHRFGGGLFGPWQVGDGSAVHAFPAASHFITVPAATQR